MRCRCPHLVKEVFELDILAHEYLSLSMVGGEKPLYKCRNPCKRLQILSLRRCRT